MSPSATPVDRAALVRRGLLELVAERGFTGGKYGRVPERAGVGTHRLLASYH